MIGFTGAGLDRADHLRLDAGRLAELMANGEARLLRLDTLDPLLDEAGRLLWSPLQGAEGEYLFLGLEEGIPHFAPLPRLERLGERAWAVFRLLALMSPKDAAIWAAARSLIEWHNRHGYCGICGTPTASFRAGWGRKCPGCGAEHFPRVDPVVIMLAEHEGRVLVARQHQYPPGRYSALAGFVEPGESIEEAVARELMEEAGVAVRGVRYVASQPWPFPGSLMIACLAQAESDALTLDPTELEHGFWVDRAGVLAALAGAADAPFLAPPPFAIANTLLTRWSEERP
ncbi:MAG TPA: NAD(+) diphosphatase [Allosphingosinicella sp.]|nr:NAD(+) diphosphatase [Allosphingosinicella sp.]